MIVFRHFFVLIDCASTKKKRRNKNPVKQMKIQTQAVWRTDRSIWGGVGGGAQLWSWWWGCTVCQVWLARPVWLMWSTTPPTMSWCVPRPWSSRASCRSTPPPSDSGLRLTTPRHLAARRESSWWVVIVPWLRNNNYWFTSESASFTPEMSFGLQSSLDNMVEF